MNLVKQQATILIKDCVELLKRIPAYKDRSYDELAFVINEYWTRDLCLIICKDDKPAFIVGYKFYKDSSGSNFILDFENTVEEGSVVDITFLSCIDNELFKLGFEELSKRYPKVEYLKFIRHNDLTKPRIYNRKQFEQLIERMNYGRFIWRG